MKKLVLSLLALAAMALVAQAQSYGILSTTTADTGIVAGATSNLNYTIDVRKMKDLGIQVYLKQTGAGTDNHTLTFSKSVDGVNWGTIAGGKLTMTVPGNGTTAVVAVTNVAVNGFGYLRLESVANGDSGDAITNLLVKFALKLNAP